MTTTSSDPSIHMPPPDWRSPVSRRRAMHEHPLAQDNPTVLRAQRLAWEDWAAKRAALEDRCDAIKEPADRQIRMMIAVTNQPEHVSGRGNLLRHAIVPLPPQELVSDDDLHDELWTAIEALAECGIYLLNTDHLCDRDLYARLYLKVLDEPNAILPPGLGAVEFIDVLHPMDHRDAPEDSVSARLVDREPPERAPEAGPGVRGPLCLQRGAMSDRDRWLPRPKDVA